MVLHNEYIHQPNLPCLSNLRFFLGGGGWGVEESLDRWLKLIMLKVHHQSDSDILKNLSNQESDDDDDDDDVIIESEEEPIDSG